LRPLATQKHAATPPGPAKRRCSENKDPQALDFSESPQLGAAPTLRLMSAKKKQKRGTQKACGGRGGAVHPLGAARAGGGGTMSRREGCLVGDDELRRGRLFPGQPLCRFGVATNCGNWEKGQRGVGGTRRAGEFVVEKKLFRSWGSSGCGDGEGRSKFVQSKKKSAGDTSCARGGQGAMHGSSQAVRATTLKTFWGGGGGDGSGIVSKKLRARVVTAQCPVSKSRWVGQLTRAKKKKSNLGAEQKKKPREGQGGPYGGPGG